MGWSVTDIMTMVKMVMIPPEGKLLFETAVLEFSAILKFCSFSRL